MREISHFNIIGEYVNNMNKLENIVRKKEGKGIIHFNNPQQLVSRLELLAGSILAGNNGVKQELSVAKQGGNLFSSLASLGARVLPYAVKGLSKAAPALATGAISALGSLGIDKIFGKGMHIPKKFFPILPSIVNEFTQAQLDQINRVMQNGGRLVIKPTRKQLDGAFLGALASIGIPIAIELV